MKNGAPQGPIFPVISRVRQIGANRCITMK